MTTVKKRPQSRKASKKGPDIAALVETFRRFRELKRAEAASKTLHEKLRDDELMPALVEYGRTHGEQGQHLAIDLPEAIDGYVRLVRRANTSTFLNIDRAEALAEKGGFLPQVQTTTVTIRVPAEKQAELLKALDVLDVNLKDAADVQTTTVFDQDRLYAYHQANRDKLTEKQMDSLLDSEVKFAFFPEKS